MIFSWYIFLRYLKIGSIENSFFTLPFGLPKCEAKINDYGLFSNIKSIDGKDDFILKSFETSEFFIGTLKSVLIKILWLFKNEVMSLSLSLFNIIIYE